MAEIFADASDGLVSSGYQSSWAAARDATSGTVSGVANSTATPSVYTARGAARGGGNTYIVKRMFMWFDTSGITGNVSAASINIYSTGTSWTSAAQVAKSTAFGGDGGTALAAGDFDAITGWSAGNNASGNVTEYASLFSGTATLNAYNSFAGTSDLMADMQNNPVVILCFMDYARDWRNSTWLSNSSVQIGNYFADQSGTDKDPKIIYTEDASGYTHDIMGVAAGNIGKVINVATANIGKVIGV
mgnify:FL=1|jgi:hypothetical protein|tara:strand:+ start:977 stop:1711 length:735 start_codon:yes stop_codon:yes gene_type:complete